MRESQLKEYLGIASEMEQTCFLQEQLRLNLESKYKCLGIPKNIPRPILEEVTSSFGISTIGIGLLFGAIAWFIAGFFLYGNIDGYDPGIAFFVFVICGAVIYSGIIISGDSAAAKENEEKYSKALALYNQDKAKDEARVQNEKLQKIFIENELGIIAETYRNTKSKLDKIYAKNILYPKYRNFVAVCTMYEYISSGRCSELEGRDGAYNLYEMESRMDKIVTSLDQAVRILSSIENTQYMLYKAIQTTNSQTKMMIDSTNQLTTQISKMGNNIENVANRLRAIEENSVIHKYQAERMTKELEYMNRMNLIFGHYDNLLF